MSNNDQKKTGEWTRRAVLKITAYASFLSFFPETASAKKPALHALSVFNDARYSANFKHFDHVWPLAPKGGRISTTVSTWAYNQNPFTFNSLNSFILKGNAAAWIENTFDTLMVSSGDESGAMYGLIAHSVIISNDKNRYRFLLRPEARFHDGTPLTADDVAFSLNILREEGHPLITMPLREMIGATATSKSELLVTFSGKQTRDLPLMVAGMPIFSKAYYSKEKFNHTTLKPPLSSGPYKVGNFKPNHFIEYERITDYWAKNLPVNIGRWNFDTVRLEFYRDPSIAFEAFKSGYYLLREESSSQKWSTDYNFPAVKDRRIIQITLPNDAPSGTQGWFINGRRAKLADPRVRKALIITFDFEWANAHLMFNSYKRSHSVFENSDMKAVGKPKQAELALLNEFRDTLSQNVFEEPFTPPVSDGSGRDRQQRRIADALLNEAGWKVKNGQRVNVNGERFVLEILSNNALLEPHINSFIASLGQLGIEASIRVVDPVQYQNRLHNFDFDLVTSRFAISTTPGTELRLLFGAESARIKGSHNLSGIDDPVVDILIERIIEANSREELKPACRALDRVLRNGYYWIPHWYRNTHWIAMWNQFDRPNMKPRYTSGIMDTWWHSPSGMKEDA